ncbi:MAG: hypothetical protein KF819_39610 [Labilithrix sp.]|nr:hypothetical protein [Labilithrix sp.]
MSTTSPTAAVILSATVLAACGGSALAPVPAVSAPVPGETAASVPAELASPAEATADARSPGAPGDDPCAKAWWALKDADPSSRATESERYRQYLESEVLGADHDIEGHDDLEPLRRTVSEAKRLLANLKCADPAAGAALEPRVTKWIAETEPAIDAQQRCRADVGCATARLKKLFCATAAELRREQAAEKAAEKAAAADRARGAIPEYHPPRDEGCVAPPVATLTATMLSFQEEYKALTGKDISERACKR